MYDLSNSAIFNYLNNYLGLPRVQGHAIIQRWISQKRYKLDTWLLQTRPLLRSDMWPIELCRRQWPWWTIVLAVFVWNQCSLLVRFLIGNQTKDDIADDLERPLKVISGYYKRFHCLYLKNTMMYKVNYNGQTSYVSYYFHYCIRPKGLLFDTEHDLLATAEHLHKTSTFVFLHNY